MFTLVHDMLARAKLSKLKLGEIPDSQELTQSIQCE